MDKFIKKTIPASQYRDALMGFKYKPYRVVSITRMDDNGNYRLVLEKNDGEE